MNYKDKLRNPGPCLQAALEDPRLAIGIKYGRGTRESWRIWSLPASIEYHNLSHQHTSVNANTDLHVHNHHAGLEVYSRKRTMYQFVR